MAKFSPQALITFLHLAETKSFTTTGRQLKLGVSTVSLQIASLEDEVGSPVLTRTRGRNARVELTPAGMELARLARPIVAAHARVTDHFRASSEKGRVRLAIADDIAAGRHVGDALRGFGLRNPGVAVEITVGQSGALHRRLRAGQFDLALIKRMPAPEDAVILRSEDITWTIHPDAVLDIEGSIPLIAYPTSSFLRNRAVSELERVGRPWHIANIVRGVNGAMTAVRGGLGLGVFGSGMVPDDLAPAPASWGLPGLGRVETVIIDGKDPAPPAGRLRQALVAWGPDLLP